MQSSGALLTVLADAYTMAAQAIFAQKHFNMVHTPLPLKHRKSGNPSGALPDFNDTSEIIWVDAAETVPEGAAPLSDTTHEYFVDPNIWKSKRH